MLSEETITKYEEGILTLYGVYEKCETDLEMYKFLSNYLYMSENKIKEEMRFVSGADDAYYNALSQMEDRDVQMAENVANYFLDCMKENDFETFEDMKRCYGWTSQDIKDEVNSVLNNYDWDIDDESDVLSEDGCFQCTYRSFIAKVYKIIK